MFDTACTTPSGAIFSEDRVYRYMLWRVWDPALPIMVFVGLNPSTADENDNDRTITRVIAFAQKWGYGGILMLNLFAYVSTVRMVLTKLKSKAIGEHNDLAICKGVHLGKRIVLGWGNDGIIDNRSCFVLGMVKTGVRELGNRELCVLKWTDKNQPQHPLYLPKSLEPIMLAS